MMLKDDLFNMQKQYTNNYRQLVNDFKSKVESVKKTYKEDKAREVIQQVGVQAKEDIRKLNNDYIKEYEKKLSDFEAKNKLQQLEQKSNREKLSVEERLLEVLESNNRLILTQARLNNATETEILDILNEYDNDTDVIKLIKAGLRGRENMENVRIKINSIENSTPERQLEGAQKALTYQKGHALAFDIGANVEQDLGLIEFDYFDPSSQDSFGE